MTARRVQQEEHAILRERRQGLPDALVHIIDRLLSKQPTEPFVSTAAVAAALSDCLTRLLTGDLSLRDEQSASPRAQRQRWLWLIPAIAVMTGLGAWLSNPTFRDTTPTIDSEAAVDSSNAVGGFDKTIPEYPQVEELTVSQTGTADCQTIRRYL